MKKKAIVYSLFGYGKQTPANCFSFSSYLRGLMLNVRMNRLLFPDWIIILETDELTYAQFRPLFESIRGLEVRVNPPAPLCLAMLWRLKPVYETGKDRTWKYSHVLCRDLDSPPTFREAQCVQYWINRDKAMHAITDSVSHTLPLLGGMIGVRPDYFTERAGQSWEEMIGRSNGMTFTGKGSDQDFLNRHIYPLFAQKGSDSITQHYFLGYGETWLSDFKKCGCHSVTGHEPRCPLDIEVYTDSGQALPYALKESNATCGHIGAAGPYMPELLRFLRTYKDQFTDLIEIEKQYPKELFHWAFDGAFD